MIEVVERQLEGGLAVASLRRGRVGFLAQLAERADVDVGGQVEVRDGLLRLNEPGGDGPAHAVERHFLERHVAIERHDLGGTRAGGCCGAHARRARRCLLDVLRDDAAMRPPLPLSRERSMPRSAASRRASGVTAVPPGKRAGP